MSFSNHDQDHEDFFQKYFQAHDANHSDFLGNDNARNSAFGGKDNCHDLSENGDFNNPPPRVNGKTDNGAISAYDDNDGFIKNLESRALENEKNKQKQKEYEAEQAAKAKLAMQAEFAKQAEKDKRRELFISRMILILPAAIPILMFLGFVLFMLSEMFGDVFIHISNNEEFDRVAQHLGFEVTRQKEPTGERSIATFKGCTVTFEDSHDNIAATKTYFDLGGNSFSGRSHSVNNISSGIEKTNGEVEAMYRKLETTVVAAQLSPDDNCKPEVDKLFKLIGYDSLHWDHPIRDEISRRFSMLIHGL